MRGDQCPKKGCCERVLHGLWLASGKHGVAVPYKSAMGRFDDEAIIKDFFWRMRKCETELLK